MSDKKKIILSLYYIRPLLVLLIILLFYSGGYMHLQILESMIRVMLILGFVGVSLLNNKNNKLVKEKENQLLQDAQTLREFISSIDNVHESKVVKKSQMITFHKNLSNKYAYIFITLLEAVLAKYLRVSKGTYWKTSKFCGSMYARTFSPNISTTKPSSINPKFLYKLILLFKVDKLNFSLSSEH